MVFNKFKDNNVFESQPQSDNNQFEDKKTLEIAAEKF